jgi:hypothetical protein
MLIWKTGKWKYRWWSSHHPAVTYAFLCTDDECPPLVTAEVVPDLLVDGWEGSTSIMKIQIQLSSIPSDLSTFLRQLPVSPIMCLPLVDSEIIFPVDTART